MFTLQKADYGYGWQVAPRFNRRLTMHGGDTLGFMGFLQRFTDDRVTIVLLSNKGYMNVLTLARDLPAIVFGEEYQLPQKLKKIAVDQKILAQYAGEYRLSEQIVFTITLEDGKTDDRKQLEHAPERRAFRRIRNDLPAHRRGRDIYLRARRRKRARDKDGNPQRQRRDDHRAENQMSQRAARSAAF